MRSSNRVFWLLHTWSAACPGEKSGSSSQLMIREKEIKKNKEVVLFIYQCEAS